jgi:outer membrane protein OmpA-like peptidoglycan-associated protein
MEVEYLQFFIFNQNCFQMKKFLILSLGLLVQGLAYSQTYETYIEDFNDNKNEWSENDTDSRFSKVQEGKFIIEQKDDGASGFWNEIIVNPHYDYTIEASFTQLSGVEDNGYGLLFGRYDWDDYYSFVVTSTGFAKIYCKIDGEREGIVEWKEFEAVNGLGQRNILKVDQIDDVVSFYVNGKLFHSCESLPLVGELTGFKIDEEKVVEVDFLHMKYKERKINLIDNPENGFEKINLGPNVNTVSEDKSPFITVDGNFLYFNRKNHAENFKEDQTDIWVSEYDSINDSWKKAIHLGAPLNNAGHNFLIGITPDGNKALLGNTYLEDGGVGFSGVSLSYKKNGNWQIPVEQTVRDFTNNDKYVNYYLTSDGTKLLSSIDDGETHGNKDLFVSFLQGDSSWTKPLNMGATLNSFMTEFSPFLASDNKTLYFSSYGHPGFGSSDIFVSTRLDESWTNWSTPKNLGPEINTELWDAYFVMAADGEDAYLVSSHDGFGKGDIFRIKVPKEVKPEPVLIVKGKVVDQKTNEPIDAFVEYENLSSQKREGVAHSYGWDGYKIVLPAGHNFGFRAEAEGYIPVSQNIDLSNLAAYSDTSINLFMVPIEKGQMIRLNNIFFDEGKSTLRDESEMELRRMVDILVSNNNLHFEIQGHTDDHGEDKANKYLSEYRAKEVLKFLIEHGIPEERLSYKGYGHKKPIDTNDTEIGRQNNRRVEIKIKKD